MSVSLDTAISELKAGAIADPSTHLKPKGKEQLQGEIDRWASRGLRAHVLVVDLGDPFETLITAFDKLGYDKEHDLLLVFNTRDWVARGWGLSESQIQRALDAARPHQHEVFAKELIDAIDHLASAANPKVGTTASGEEKHDSSFPVLPVVGGIAVVTVGGLVGLAIMRRGKLAKEGGAKLADAQASAEKAYADLMLACEDLPADSGGTDLQLKAAELKKRLDTVVEEIRAQPHKGTDPVMIGKIRQLENELAALRSTVLQKEKG